MPLSFEPGELALPAKIHGLLQLGKGLKEIVETLDPADVLSGHGNDPWLMILNVSS